jgi:hypothetical protein
LAKENRKSVLPVWAIILDLIGTLVLVVGILAQFGGEGALFPESPETRALAYVLILAGVLLMAPLVVILIRRAIAANR